MQKIKKVLFSKQAKRFYWQTLNGAIGLGIMFVTGLDWIFAPAIIAILNGFTKEINNYLSK